MPPAKAECCLVEAPLAVARAVAVAAACQQLRLGVWQGQSAALHKKTVSNGTFAG